MREYSVLMSVYKNDNPQHVRDAICSMIHQTVGPSEIVLVKDGPIRKELDSVLNKLKEEYPNLLKVISLEKNMGLGLALRRGMDECQYDLVARMDSDDIAYPTRIEQQIAYFEKDESIDILGGDIEEFIDLPSNIVSVRKVPCTDIAIKKYIKYRCPFNHVTVMFKKEAVLKVGGYQHWPFNEDYYLWIRMMEHGCIMANTGTPLVKVRVGKEMYSRRGGNQYFFSEKKIQDYMLEKGIITFPVYLKNVAIRFVVQKILTPSVRGYIFKKFARS